MYKEKNENKQSLSDFITNDLEISFSIILLMLNTLILLWLGFKFNKIIKIYLKMKDPTLMYINIMLFILTGLRIQAYSYAVIGCFLGESGKKYFQPSVFRTFQSSSYIFYDLTLGVIGAKWIAILQKFFHYFKKIKKLNLMINIILIVFWLSLQVFLIVAEYYHHVIWDTSIEQIFSLLYFFYSLIALFIFIMGSIKFRQHLKHIQTISDQYNRYLGYAIIFLLFGLTIRLIFSQLKFWCNDFLIRFKYGFDDASTKDSISWSIISFIVYFLSDFFPTLILLYIFCPKSQRNRKNKIVEESNVEIE